MNHHGTRTAEGNEDLGREWISHCSSYFPLQSHQWMSFLFRKINRNLRWTLEEGILMWLRNSEGNCYSGLKQCLSTAGGGEEQMRKKIECYEDTDWLVTEKFSQILFFSFLPVIPIIHSSTYSFISFLVSTWVNLSTEHV